MQRPLPFSNQLVVGTTDCLNAYPNARWRTQLICNRVTKEQWVDLSEIRAHSWLTDDQMNVVNRHAVRACCDYFVFDNRRIVLHVRREPGGGEPFPSIAKAAVTGALWPSGGMLPKPTGPLDGSLDFPATLLIKVRTELKNYLHSPEQILGVHHAGIGFTTFHQTSTYTLGDGSERVVHLAAGLASVTLNETVYLQVTPGVIDALERDSEVDSSDLSAHVIVTPESWPEIKKSCLPYVIAFIDNFYG